MLSRSSGRVSRLCSAARVSLHSQTASTTRRVNGTGWLLASSAAAVTTVVWYTTVYGDAIHNDAPPIAQTNVKWVGNTRPSTMLEDEDLSTLVWGSNRAHVLHDELPDTIRIPTTSAWFKNVALRDLALHENHAACIDARGDVYQWGDGFTGSQPGSLHARPELTLKGKNITQLQLTRTRLFALSASGRIYVLSTRQDDQTLATAAQTPASTPWWGTGWLWGEEEQVDFAEIIASEKLQRRERFVQISAGTDHLLAVTSDGRTFAHPVSLNGNSHGQLGFRRCDVPAPENLEHVHLPHQHPRVQLELTPRSVADPYAKSSPAIRPTGSPTRLSEAFIGKDAATTSVNDTNLRWSDRLFEVPALRGIKVDRIATGGRSSFVKTVDGRVLGWGANEYGQIGLGANVTLEAITVPTEVILWRSTPGTMRTKCLDIFAGGDLTAFEVERSDGTAMPYIDVLVCGNGQYGGLGNAQFTNAQSTPVRVKNVSGLLEYNESSKNLQPIVPEAISISPTGHVLATLDTKAQAGPGGGGRDVVVWGANFEYQLGTGKRGSVAMPTALQSADSDRFMLHSKRAREVRDLQGRVWKTGVQVGQQAVAGWNNSVVYWRIQG